MGKDSKKFSFEAKVIVRYIRDNRNLLLWTTVAAAVLSLGVSFMIKPKYKSTAVIYPASYSDNKPWFDLKDNKAWFGQLYEIDQYMQIITSEEVRDKIIKKYNLGEHYGIPASHKYYRTRVNGMYESNISFVRTRYQSIQVRVLDEDPQWAANIANDIVMLSDSIMNKIYKQKNENDARIYEIQYKTYMEFMNAIADSMSRLGQQYGIADIEHQSQELERSYNQALASGNGQAAEVFGKRLKEMARLSGLMQKHKSILEKQADYFSKFMGSYINAKTLAGEDMPYSYKFIVDYAKPADKKYIPKRTLIIIVSTLSTFLLTLAGLMCKDYIEKLVKD